MPVIASSQTRCTASGGSFGLIARHGLPQPLDQHDIRPDLALAAWRVGRKLRPWTCVQPRPHAADASAGCSTSASSLTREAGHAATLSSAPARSPRRSA